MNTSLRVFSITVLLVVFAQPAVAGPDDNHDKWIDVLSIDWGSHQPGASTDLEDGNYKDKKGRYVVVQRGKVVTRGWDYRKKEPIRAKATRTRPQGSKDIKTREDEEEASLLLPAVQKVREAAPKKEPSRQRDVKPRPQEGVEPDEIDNR